MPDTQRVIWIDVARTIAIVLMVLYHLLFDLQYWYGVGVDVREGHWFAMGRSAAILFLLLVGASFVVSARRRTPRQIQWRALERGALLLSWGMAITLVTYLTDPGTYIRFGILHCIGVSVLLLLPVHRLGAWNLAIGAAWFAITPLVQGDATNEALVFLGRMPTNFSTLDYYPLFPWTGWVFLGAGFGPLLLRLQGAPDRTIPKIVRVLTWPGRHALGVYLVHQPILLASLWLLARTGLLQ